MQCNNVYDTVFMRDIQIERMSIGFTNLNAGDGYAVIFVGSPFFTEASFHYKRDGDDDGDGVRGIG